MNNLVFAKSHVILQRLWSKEMNVVICMESCNFAVFSIFLFAINTAFSYTMSITTVSVTEEQSEEIFLDMCQNDSAESFFYKFKTL